MAIRRDKILKTAEKLVQKGRLDQAIKEYEKLLEASPDDTNTINRLGDLYGRVGEIENAVELYQRVAEKFADQGFLPKAIAIYKKINRLAPQRLDIFERLGDLYLEQGLMVEAKNQFKMLAEHYSKNDEIENAMRAHQRLAEIDPGDASARLRFADLLLESGKAEQAMGAYRALGETLLQHNKIDEAERLFRRLLDHEIPDGEIMVPICDRLLDSGRVTAAHELLTAALEVSGTSTPLRTLQVRAFMALGETQKAIAMAREILHVDPENAEVRGLVGNVMISDGDPAEATEMMIPAAESLLEKADYSKAQKMLRELVEIAPEDERVLRLAIRAFRPSGDQDMLTKLTASLADVCFTKGQEDQAKRFYLELVAVDPANALYRERLAELDQSLGGAASDRDAEVTGDDIPSEISFTLDGDQPQAVDVASPAEEAEPLTFDPEERINEAAVFAKYGLNDKAIRHLEGVLRRLPGHAGAREALAGIYLSIGERERAIQTIEPVIEEHRSSGGARAAAELEELYGIESMDLGTEDRFEDDLIIVEIDGDELSGADLEEVATDAEDSVTDAVAGSIAELERDLDDGGAPGAVTFPDDEFSQEPSFDLGLPDEIVVEDELVEELVEEELVDEELVEISTGADGPSFNDLAQLDLFIDQELLDDALSILERLETEYPGDRDLAERRTKLEGLGATARAQVSPERSRTVETPRKDATPSRARHETFEDEPEEGYIDLARELEAELAEEEAMVEEATGRGKGEALLEEVFKEFQKGVAEQLSEEDSDTHFNLGIAYKEMGLLEEAIGEFRVSSHDPAFFVEACTMIGVCATELGRFDEAAEWYQKALVAPDLTTDARTALRYELASAYERTGKLEQAVDLFSQIHSHDPAYRDVGIRLAEITEQQRQIN